MNTTNTKRTDWTIALDSIIDSKCENISDEIINSLVFLEENYHAGINYKITGVPDLRFLTNLGKKRHFFLIKSSCEIHIYLIDPSLTLNKYPFLHDKGSPKNHYRINSSDARRLKPNELRELLFNSFSYISNAVVDDISNFKGEEQNDSIINGYIPNKNDLEEVLYEIGGENINIEKVNLLNAGL